MFNPVCSVCNCIVSEIASTNDSSVVCVSCAKQKHDDGLQMILKSDPPASVPISQNNYFDFPSSDISPAQMSDEISLSDVAEAHDCAASADQPSSSIDDEAIVIEVEDSEPKNGEAPRDDETPVEIPAGAAEKNKPAAKRRR